MSIDRQSRPGASGKFALLLDGMPGVGKTTIAQHLSRHLPESVIVSSSELRMKHDLRNLLSDSHRARLHEIILKLIDDEVLLSANWLILDVNLMDSASRLRIIERLTSRHVSVCFFHITASEVDIAERTKNKFNTKPMFTRDYLDESDIISFVRNRMEPLQGSERDMLNIYVHYDTSQQAILYDVADDTFLGTAVTLVQLLETQGSRGGVSRVRFFGSPKSLASQVMNYKNSYIGRLRRLVGHQPLIVPSIRAVLFDDEKILLVRRRDNNRWSLPAGGMELDESIYDTLRREVSEETGLQVTDATIVSIHSEPRFKFTNQFGDRYQRLALVFRVNRWSGTLVREMAETIDARFFARNEMPNLSAAHIEAIEDVDTYTGGLQLK